MIRESILAQTRLQNPIAEASIVRPKGRSRVKNLVAGITLTSLVDAFSILVIYLLVSFSNSGEMLYISKDMQLPMAANTKPLQRSTIIKIEKDKFFIEKDEVEKSQIVERLIDIRKDLFKADENAEFSLTLQADRRITYEVLNDIVLASSQAGFNEVKFAVLTE